MLIVFPFCAKDVDRLHDLLQWCAELGKSKHPALLVADPGVPWMDGIKAIQLAEKAFSAVHTVTLDEHVEGWIPGSNALFLRAAQEAKLIGKPWLFLEPDAVPVKAGWIEALEDAYGRCGKPFMGPMVSHGRAGLPSPYLEGVSIYPADAVDAMAPVFTNDRSWTFACASVVVPQAVNTPLIQHLWGEASRPPTFAEKNVPGTNVFCLRQIKPEAVIFHRCKDDSLVRLLRKRQGLIGDVKKFCHGGDVGDVIYGLCAVKAAGGGELYLVPHTVRDPFTQAKADLLLPLLRVQPYLKSASFYPCPMIPFKSKDKPEFVDHDLNQFRPVQFERRSKGLWEDIAASHLRVLGLDLGKSNNGPWLTVDEPVTIPGKPVLFHRSPRYHNSKFQWKRIWAKYSQKAVFVGTEPEYHRFQNQIGKVPFHPTKDFLELARVIAGAKLFVGNQSAPYAIAEGLKQNAILEACPQVPDCQFKRENLQNSVQGFCVLPEL